MPLCPSGPHPAIWPIWLPWEPHIPPWPHQPSRAWGSSSTLLSLALMQTWLWLYSLLKVCVSRRKHCRERRRTVGHEAHPTSHSSWAFSCHNPQLPVEGTSWFHPHQQSLLQDPTFTASSFCLSLGVSGGEVRLSGAPSAESGEEMQEVLRDSESSLEQGDRVSMPRRWVVSSFSRSNR